MSFDLAFVDRVAAVPTERLNLHSKTGPLRTVTADFGMPELDKARSSTLMVDGELISGSAYGNRIVTITLRLPGSDTVVDYDAAAAAIQNVSRELNRETNFLRYRAGTSKAQFYQTFRSEYNRIEWDGSNIFATITVEAWTYGIGELETLAPVTVYNDPNEGATLNLNPFFETNVSDWSVSGGTFVRSTAQAHEGAASGLLTPDGVTATTEANSVSRPVTVGVRYGASAWVRCAVARNVDIRISWRDGGGAQLSQTTDTVAVAANTWTYVHTDGVAPASAATALMRVAMTGTPPAGNTLHIDEARLHTVGGVGGMCFDITGIKGDADTPLYLSFGPTLFNQITVPRRTLLGVRRRGNPAAMVLPLQAEAMTLGTDTTLPGNDQTASGGGSNYARCNFATNTNLITRLTAATYPANPGQDLRGQYQVYIRHRKTGGGTAQLRLLWGAFNGLTSNPTVNNHPDAASDRWAWADLGIVQFPQGVDPETDGLSGVPISSAGMRFEVQMGKGGATSVDADYLLFVPVDDLVCSVIIPSGAAGTSAIVVDPAKAMAYGVGGAGEVRSDRMVSVRGGAPYARPGVTNRWWMIVDLTGQVNANINGDQLFDAHMITPSYYPLYLGVARPEAS